MKRILILGVVIMGLGLFLVDHKLDENISEIRVVEEKIVVGEYSGSLIRMIDGEEAFFYRYNFPREIIEEKFNLDDSINESYEEIVDYEKVRDNEYIVELYRGREGTVIHKGAEEVSVVIVARDNFSRVEDALREHNFLDEKMSEKLELLEEIVFKKNQKVN